MIDDAATLLADLYPGSTRPDRGWRECVESSLSVDQVMVSEPLMKQADQARRRLVGLLSVEAKDLHRRELGLVAQRAFRFLHLHRGCAGDLSSAIRAAQDGFGSLAKGGRDGDREFRRADNVALWVMSLWSYRSALLTKTTPLVTGRDPSSVRHRLMWLGSRNRWPSRDHLQWRSDIRHLTADDPRARRLFERLERLLEVPLAETERIVAFHDQHERPVPPCYCADPATVLEAFWGGLFPASWTRLDLDEADSALVRRVVAAAEPRRDVMRVRDDVIAVESQGVLDAILVAALDNVSTERASSWQERAVFRELRQATLGRDHAWPNVNWAGRSGHGEVDALAIIDGLVVDCQAKAARSRNHRGREELVVTGAHEQHARFASNVSEGVRLSLTGGRPVRPGTLVLDPARMLHLPISVGVETVHQYGIGASALDPPRVLTTVDHLRLVNRVLPDIYRMAYWADRYVQELSPLRFIDEVDFLGRWHAMLSRREPPLRVMENLVLAEDSVVEQWLTIGNTFRTVERSFIEKDVYLRGVQRELTSGYPTSRAPTMTRMLRELLIGRAPGAVGLIRATAGIDYEDIEERLRRRRDVFVRNPIGTWAVTWNPRGGLDPARYAQKPDFLVAVVNGRWRLAQAAPWQAADRLRPRWRPGGLSR